MAEGVLFDVAAKIIKQLGSLAVHEIGLARSVEDDITQLKDIVCTIQGILLDAEEQHSKKNNEVTAWLQRLKDTFYDADDLLDYYYTQFQQRKVMTMAKKVRIFFSKSNQTACSLKMAHEIKKIKERLESIYNARPPYLNERFVNEKSVVNLERETHSFVHTEKVIGRGDEKNDLIKFLFDSNDDQNVSVLSICGLGGLGKTTLAQLVYNDENVISYFQLRMWVCVSDEFNMKLIIEKIIKSITHEEPKKLELDQLQERLRKEIEGKRYLLVLDDIWNENPNIWDKLKNLLLNGARGSKILVTTRSEQVAKITSKHSFYIYPLRELAEDESWSLFKQIAFERGIEPKDSMLVEIGKEILAKCGGVPLAIMTIGHLLYGNNKENDWLHFKDNEMSKIIQEESDILPILKLSYDHLPSHLKQCFAYCALFPKDYEIEKQKLIHLWSAQGFLQGSNKKECPEDIGNKYFMALLLRSFFQDPKYDEWGNIIACKMHDLMHDLAQFVAGIECIMVALDTIDSVDIKCRHLALDCSEISRSFKFPTTLYNAKNIRSLLLLDKYSNWGYKVDDGYEILTTYRHLRTLDFGRIKFQKLFMLNGKLNSSIAKLGRLRYLNISWMNINFFPKSILRLWNLETLDLSYCDQLIELPRDISKMVNLRHLIIQGCNSLLGMPHGLGLLTNLQTLSLFVASKRNSWAIRKSKYSGIDELNRLNNLRGELEIQNLKYVEDGRLANLNEKRFLQSLILNWGWSSSCGVEGIDEVVLEGLKPHPNLKEITIRSFKGVKFCNWFSSLTNLTSISITYCGHCQSVLLLNKFPHLKSLSLTNLCDLEYISEEASNSCSSTLSATFFPSLKEVTLYDCPKLKGWWQRDVDDGGELPSFPCLSKLYIYRCPNLLSMPLYPSLEKLDLWDTSSKPLLQTIMLVNSVGPSTSSNFSTPLSKLKSMMLYEIPDLEFLPVEGMRNLTSLVDLNIKSCSRLTQVHQGIRFLTSLQNLTIESCHELDFLMDDVQYLTSLQKLIVGNCDQFESANNKDDNDIPWQDFRSLQSLRIYGLPKLVSLPKGLRYLTSLQNLSICNCDKFESPNSEDDNAMPWQGFKSLQYLILESLPKLVSLPKGFQYLTSLQNLTIRNCNQFESPSSEDDNDMPWQGLRSLQSLKLESLPKLVYLSKGFQYLTSLQKLTICGCNQLESLGSKDDDDMPWQGFRSLQSLNVYVLPKLVSLPKGIQYVTTLQDLIIGDCYNLIALPEWISNSSSLSRLVINFCPKLSERCKNNIGMDWPKIAHIPNVKIDFQWIQYNGCYLYSSSTDGALFPPFFTIE